VSRLALALPPLERPVAAASGSVDVPTRALPLAAPPVPAGLATIAAPVLPAARPAASHAGATPLRRRRSRSWIVVGSVAASLALVLIVGLWALNAAGGAVGPVDPPMTERTPSSTPAPAEAVVTGEDRPVDTTVGTVPASDVERRDTGDSAADDPQPAAPADQAPGQTEVPGPGSTGGTTSPGVPGPGTGTGSATGPGLGNGNGESPGQNSGNGPGQNSGKTKDAAVIPAPAPSTSPAP
jgi:hypothetical protein